AALGPIAASGTPHRGERLLDGVLGARAIAQHAHREPEQWTDEAAVQGLESCTVSIGGSSRTGVTASISWSSLRILEGAGFTAATHDCDAFCRRTSRMYGSRKCRLRKRQ